LIKEHLFSEAQTRRPRRFGKPNHFIASAVALLALSALTTRAQAQAVSLGSAADFTIISSQGITNSGNSVVTGAIALSPVTSIVGFSISTSPGPGVVTGDVHYNDTVAQQAQTDALSAFNTLAGVTTYTPT